MPPTPAYDFQQQGVWLLPHYTPSSPTTCLPKSGTLCMLAADASKSFPKYHTPTSHSPLPTTRPKERHPLHLSGGRVVMLFSPHPCLSYTATHPSTDTVRHGLQGGKGFQAFVEAILPSKVYSLRHAPRAAPLDADAHKPGQTVVDPNIVDIDTMATARGLRLTCK
uniref:Uncharacterized protein n=1 Tax=Mycena chlorophos TaxID=658473 RepID=A0ABQ0L860_MYCCL|nr:predicted protein [Mycena chlorophos]